MHSAQFKSHESSGGCRVFQQQDGRNCNTFPSHTWGVSVYQLKELPSAVTVSCKGWDCFTSSNDSLSIILLSPTTCTGSRGHPRMELDFVISSLSLFLSPHQSKRPELPQQMDAGLTFLTGRCSVIGPVQFIVQVNSQVLVDVSVSIFVAWIFGCLCLRKSTTSFGLPSSELESVLLAPVHKVHNKFSVGFVVPAPDEANDSRIVCVVPHILQIISDIQKMTRLCCHVNVVDICHRMSHI